MAGLMGRELAGMKVAVLGSTSGIGRAVALALADGGADVIVHGYRSAEQANEVAAAIRERGVRSSVHMADLADTLTGAAGQQPFDAKLDQLWAVDVAATIRLCRLVGRKMVQQGHGAIVTVGWDQAETGMEGDSGELFAATKGAVMAFTRSLALSLAPNIRVNNLAPGWIKTAWGDTASTPWQDRVRRETPLDRWGTPDDVATAARFLIGPGATFLTGQILRVNGGVVR